jgi:hypothetical protein
MHVDDIEDYMELQNRSAKEQIRKSHAEYQRGEGRDAAKFLAELKKPIREHRKK